MEIKDINCLWYVEPVELFVEGCEIKCTECGEWANHEDWEETEVYCEDCGSHTAMRCPNCAAAHDHIHHSGFECRLPRKPYKPSKHKEL